MSVEGQDEREWVIRWEHPIRRHVLVGPVDGRQMEGLTVVPKSLLDAALAGSAARERELEAKVEALVEASQVASRIVREIRAREAVLVEALKAARAKVLVINAAGFDSTRGAFALEAIELIDAALAGVVEAEPDGSER